MRTAEKNNWKRESINLPSSIKLGAKIVATVAGFYLWGGGLYMGGFGRGFLLEYPEKHCFLPCIGKHGKIDPVGTDEIDPVKTA